MLITLYGPDSYRRIKKLNEIVGVYKSKHTGLAYERIDMSVDGSQEKFVNFLKNRSVFDTTRLLVLDNPLEAEDEKGLRKNLKENIDNKDITIIINSTNKPGATYKFLYEKQSINQDFPAVSGEKLKTLITQIADEYGAKLTEQSVSAIAESFGGDTWGIATEVAQLALTSTRNIEPHQNTDYYGLINALKNGYGVKNRIVALEIILSDRKDDPGRVFNSLAYRLSSKDEANRYANYDVAVKSGKLEYEEVLLDLAIRS